MNFLDKRSSHSFETIGLKTIFCISVIVLLFFFYRCPIKILLGIDCPGCGMMRAFLAVIRLDFLSAFHYHPLFLFFGIEAVYVMIGYIFSGRLRLPKNIEQIVFGISLILLFFVWIVRLVLTR